MVGAAWPGSLSTISCVISRGGGQLQRELQLCIASRDLYISHRDRSSGQHGWLNAPRLVAIDVCSLSSDYEEKRERYISVRREREIDKCNEGHEDKELATEETKL